LRTGSHQRPRRDDKAVHNLSHSGLAV
jgi:hypothetical protein